MQLPLNDPRTDQLRCIQSALIAHFGRIVRPPDKRRPAEWTLVQGVIGAQTRTAISNRSTDALLAQYGSWEAVADVPVGELEAMLAAQSFPRVAAERLRACLARIRQSCRGVDLGHLAGLPTEAAMNWLENLPGVARKISAQVMNTSTFARRALVIDGHHRRTMQRIGLAQDKADTARTFDALMAIVPQEWSAADMDEHHLLLKKLGQTFCRPRIPHCTDCPVHALCRTSMHRHGRNPS